MENRLRKCNRKVELLTQHIIKNRIIYILFTPILILFFSFLLKFVFKGLNIFDCFDRFIGILGFWLSLILLDSITLKEDVIEKVKLEKKFGGRKGIITDIIENAELICSYRGNYTEYKNNLKELLSANQHIIVSLRKIEKDEFFQSFSADLNKYIKLFEYYNNPETPDWYNEEKATQSYIKCISNIFGFIKAMDYELENNKFGKDWEEKIK